MASHSAQVFVVILAFVLLHSCYAQLTFTPNWGKRSGSNQLDLGAPNLNANANANAMGDTSLRFLSSHTATNNLNGNNCKPSLDSMMVIYRMIQTEAEKIGECVQK